MQPCKFALKVWNAQQAGAIGVSSDHLCYGALTRVRVCKTAYSSASSALHGATNKLGCGSITARSKRYAHLFAGRAMTDSC